MTESAFPSREELLGGFPARRASTILFAAENLTLQLVARSRRALSRYQPARDARDRERQFIDAVAGARQQQARPSIQDLERYAPEWSYLVPAVPETQAAVLHLVGTRYPLDRARCRRIRAALAADSAEVAAAYQRQQGRPIDAAYAPAIGWRERLRWWRARVAERLETMPPFWMAFSLTLTETVGGGMLALPIALAGVGVPAALVLLGVFGVISIVTIAALVEAITRDGTMRYGNGYFGQLVESRLGRPGGVAMGGALFALNAGSLLIAMTGFGLVLAAASGLPAVAWVALLFVAILWVLRRENLDATIAAALLIGVAILALAGGMIAVGLVNVRGDLLFSAPATDSAGPTSVVALVFGVLLFVFFGHTSAGNAARTVLRRDPSGRSLLWGNVLAMAVAAVIYGLFVLAVNGSVSASRLAAESGTAVTPLAEVAGPVAAVLGAAYVVLALGTGALYEALGLYNQAIEVVGRRLPQSARARFLVATAPVLGIFVLLQALLLVGAESFTGPLNLIGALTIPLLGGIFPMLILAAARRRGERVPGTPLGLLGSPVVVWSVVALYLAGLAAHALFIWTDPFERLVAAVASVGMLALIVATIRRHSFRPRTVVELRADEPPGVGMTVSVVADGRAVSERRLPDRAGNDSISVDLPPDRPDELHVWAHRPTRDGDTEPMVVEYEADVGDVPDHALVVRLPAARLRRS